MTLPGRRRGHGPAGGADRLRVLRDQLHQALDGQPPCRVHLNGHPIRRRPGTLNLGISGLRGTDLLAATPGRAASTGSACHTGTPQPSPVLHRGSGRATSALRLSIGRWTTPADIDQTVRQITASVRSLPNQQAAAP